MNEVAPGTRAVSVFYRCSDQNCGLRFPVAPRDVFDNRCPACGGPVVAAATAASTPQRSRAAAPAGSMHILLDNWRSLFNVGSVFRTADGAGVTHLYLCGITATPRQPKLAKTALGAEQVVAWSYHPDAVVLAEQLRSNGARLWALEALPSAEPLFHVVRSDLDPGSPRPLVLVAGNEVSGIDPGLMSLVERTVMVPMLGSKESLNAAVALSVVVYWLRGQMLAAGIQSES